MLRLNECFAIKRKRENRVRGAFFAICLVAAVFLLSTPCAYAELIPDQINDVFLPTEISYGSLGSVLSQGFTTTVGTVDAIDLRFRLGGSFPLGGFVDTTINLRSGPYNGPILGSATARVRNEGGGLSGQLVRFEFPSPVSVSPGQTYFIEWVAPNPGILTWMGKDNNPAAGPYPGGNAWTGLAEDPTIDYCFVTYAYVGLPLIDRGEWVESGIYQAY